MLTRRFSVLLVAWLSLIVAFAVPASANNELQIIAASDVADWIHRNVDAFNETYDMDITVHIKELWEEPYVEELTLVHAANVSFDIVQVNPGRDFAKFVEIGLFTDLNPLIERDGFDISNIYPPTFNDAVFDGKTYALAFAAHPGQAGIYYNAHHFGRMGLGDPDPNWTFDDLTQYAIRSTLMTSSSAVPAVFGMETPQFWGFAPAFNGDVINPDLTEIMPNPEGFLDALQWIVDLGDRGVMSKGEASFNFGTVAMKMQGPWEAKWLNMSMVADEWDVAPFPVGPAGRVNGGAAWDGFSIPRTAANRELAWQFIQFMLSEGPMIDYAAMGANPVSHIHVNLLPDLLNMPGREVYIRALEAGQFVFDQPQEIQSIQQNHLGRQSAVVNGSVSPAQALESVTLEIEAYLARMGRL